MITVVGGTKGGSGKSTVATNLAVMLSLAGRDVLLVDADDQETSKDFTSLRNEKLPRARAIPASASPARQSTPRPNGLPRSTKRSSSTAAAVTRLASGRR